MPVFDFREHFLEDFPCGSILVSDYLPKIFASWEDGLFSMHCLSP